MNDDEIIKVCRKIGGEVKGNNCELPSNLVRDCKGVGGIESAGKCSISKEKLASLLKK